MIVARLNERPTTDLTARTRGTYIAGVGTHASVTP